MNYDSHIQELAYQIWEAEGRPEGQAEKHWYQAEILTNTLSNSNEFKFGKLSLSTEVEKSIEHAQPDQT